MTCDGFWSWISFLLFSIKYLEGAHEGFVHAHHAAGIVKLSAVVGSREQRHQLPLSEELIAIFYHLGVQTQLTLITDAQKHQWPHVYIKMSVYVQKSSLHTNKKANICTES